jgi:S-disulfanyl-L-cysteine oxidoreductase SoxD
LHDRLWPGAEVTKRAVEINVTPEDPDGKPAGTMPDIAAAVRPGPHVVQVLPRPRPPCPAAGRLPRSIPR